MSVALVVGLGNPGEQYAPTRHNIGFRVVDTLAVRLGAEPWRSSHESLLTRAASDGVWLAKPQIYMNRSGRAVAELAAALAVPPPAILVVVDDVELPLGRLRLRRSGGPGTHNGLRHIVAEIGTSFPRLRVGVRGEERWDDLAGYVLAPFDSAEEGVVEAAVVRAAEAVEKVLDDGLERAMEIYNRRPPEPPEPPELTE